MLLLNNHLLLLHNHLLLLYNHLLLMYLKEEKEKSEENIIIQKNILEKQRTLLYNFNGGMLWKEEFYL